MKHRITFAIAIAMVLSLTAGCAGDAQTAPRVSSNQDMPAMGDSAGRQGDAAVGSKDAAPEPSDEPYTITVQNHDASGNASAMMLSAWEKDIEAASQGRIDVIIYNDGVLGGPRATLDLLSSRSVDAAWGLMSFYNDQFQCAQVISLPMMGIKNANQGSNVLWELYADYDLIKSDFESWKVLYLHTNTNNPVVSHKKISTAEDLKGMNIRVTSSGPIADFLYQLGATPVATGLSEIYTRLYSNTLDASIQGWDAVASFRLYEVTDYFLEETLVSYGQFLLMNWDSYNSLPADLQEIVDQYSGAYFLQYSAYLWTILEAEAREGAQAHGVECYRLSDETRRAFQKAADQISADWCERTPNGGEIYDTAKKLIEKYSYLE